MTAADGDMLSWSWTPVDEKKRPALNQLFEVRTESQVSGA